MCTCVVLVLVIYSVGLIPFVFVFILVICLFVFCRWYPYRHIVPSVFHLRPSLIYIACFLSPKLMWAGGDY